MRELDGEQIRHYVDTEQAFRAWAAVCAELAGKYAGAMVWKSVGGRRYLYRKSRRGAWKCLGPDGPQTAAIHKAFHEGRMERRARLAQLDERIAVIARVNRALRLGRVPLTAARVIRRIAKAGALGHGLQVVGTHALYAYEMIAGVHFAPAVIATRDVDLLYDARCRLDLIASGLAETGLTGLLQQIDKSFEPTAPGSYRAVNAHGFIVDLITPALAQPALRSFRASLGDRGDDLRAAEIAGLAWLESSPPVNVVALDERGAPVEIVAPDPRAFVCHKLWLAQRDDRDPPKRRRDRLQAEAVTRLLAQYLPHLSFADPVLDALPRALRDQGAALAHAIGAAPAGPEPDWN